MNKLYKYLPFGIKGVLSKDDYGNVINTTGTFVGYSEGIITMYDEELNPEFCEEKDFKPILRPFEDLTKELPLTKAAAEMIGMKECEVVIPIEQFYNRLGLDFNFWRNDAEFRKYDAKNYPINKYKYKDDYIELELDKWWKLEIVNVNNEFITYDYEKAFDFLRAMHFNLDFTEDEYIKLED